MGAIPVLFGLAYVIAFRDRLAKKFFVTWPYKAKIIMRYAEGLDIIEDKCTIDRRKMTTEKGLFFDTRVLFYRDSTKIPEVPQKFIQQAAGKKVLWFYQVANGQRLPLTMDGHTFKVAYQVPALDEAGNQIMRKNEKGKDEPALTWEEKAIFDGRIAVGPTGELIEVGALLAHQVYDKDYFQADEIERATKLHASSKFWEKYGNIIILGVFLIAAIVVTHFAGKSLIEMSKNAQAELGSTARHIADLCRPAAQQATGAAPY